MREVEPPGDEPRYCVKRGLGRLRRPVRPEDRDPDRSGVEAEGVRSDDVAVNASVPPLVDGPEAIDEKVVADVVPAVPLDVEELDALDDRGRFRTRIVVPARGV